MTDAWTIHEARFIQLSQVTSAANATTISSAAVPNGKVWTILAGGYYPDAPETRYIATNVATAGGSSYPIAYPVTLLLNTVARFPIVTEGMELKLFPGEYIYITRDVATAGSIMILQLRYVETDLPYYAYEEPLNKVVQTSQKHGSAYRAGAAVSQTTQGSKVTEISGGGRKGEPQPI